MQTITVRLQVINTRSCHGQQPKVARHVPCQQGPNRAEIEWDRAMAAEHPAGTPMPQLTGAASATSAALTAAKATPASITGGAAVAAGTTPASIGCGKVAVVDNAMMRAG